MIIIIIIVVVLTFGGGYISSFRTPSTKRVVFTRKSASRMSKKQYLRLRVRVNASTLNDFSIHVQNK